MRTLVSSIGLVLAIPATTALAAVLVRTAPSREGDVRRSGDGDATPAGGIGDQSADERQS
ncbi:hypothetical protein [Ruania alba]|uniref:hypothetical protein n=1 Tax=Ruania alba TaxID=648782 RepID=UPI002481F2FA|nr:hypothetical protein [Ruania alba]